MVKQNPLCPVKISSRIPIWAVETNLVFAKQFYTSTHLHTTPPPHFYETRPPYNGHPPEVTIRKGKPKIVCTLGGLLSCSLATLPVPLPTNRPLGVAPMSPPEAPPGVWWGDSYSHPLISSNVAFSSFD
jgi:hypothetical protein